MSVEIDSPAGGVSGELRGVSSELRGVSERACHVTAVAAGLHLPFNSRFLAGPQPLTRAAVFLDRDGVIVRDVHFLRTPSQIDFLKHVETLAHLRDRYYLVIATNQSGIARKIFTEEDLIAIHSGLVLQLARRGVALDAIYYCPHLPCADLASAELAAYRMDCDCRKPKPGLLLRAAREYGLDLGRSYMLGDSRRDVEAGQAAGLAGSILIVPDGSPQLAPEGWAQKDGARNLAQAVRGILAGAA
jgi:D,D-heptose 1,7-bisphosphate phosphatase